MLMAQSGKTTLAHPPRQFSTTSTKSQNLVLRRLASHISRSLNTPASYPVIGALSRSFCSISTDPTIHPFCSGLQMVSSQFSTASSLMRVKWRVLAVTSVQWCCKAVAAMRISSMPMGWPVLFKEASRSPDISASEPQFHDTDTRS